MKILKVRSEFRPEPMLHALGFKGGRLTELWQVSCYLESDTGLRSVGYGVQSVLWSDSTIFAREGQQRGNELMLKVTEFALSCLEGKTLTAPPEMMEELIPEVLAYARRLTDYPGLRTTFALNALTPVDWALWKLWQQANPGSDFLSLTAPFTHYLTDRQTCLGNIPLISYDTEFSQVQKLAEEKMSLFKIKIGSNPGGRNDPEEMLQWDMQRFSRIHAFLSRFCTDQTQCGHPVYYLDANGRYDTVERVLRFLDYADHLQALDRILILEEPFPENSLQDVRALPVTVAGDESAHGAAETVQLVEEYGYGAIALKPIAKTLSVSLQVLEEAGKRNVQCFCADLTVNPRMVEMNKLFAAHLPRLKGMNIGVFESNGGQNLQNWDRMMEEGGLNRRPWTRLHEGVYQLSQAYYACDGYIWKD